MVTSVLGNKIFYYTTSLLLIGFLLLFSPVKAVQNGTHPSTSNLEEIAIQVAAISFLFLACTVLLNHFMDDADRYALQGAMLRSKYILTKKGPRAYLDGLKAENKESEISKGAEIIEDYLRFRFMLMHFGVIYIGLIGIFAASALLLTLLAIVIYRIWGLITLILAVIIVISIIFLILNQQTYIFVTDSTARRINELVKNGFVEDCENIIKCVHGQQPPEDVRKVLLYRILTRPLLKMFSSKYSIVSDIIIHLVTVIILFVAVQMCMPMVRIFFFKLEDLCKIYVSIVIVGVLIYKTIIQKDPTIIR